MIMMFRCLQTFGRLVYVVLALIGRLPGNQGNHPYDHPLSGITAATHIALCYFT